MKKRLFTLITSGILALSISSSVYAAVPASVVRTRTQNITASATPAADQNKYDEKERKELTEKYGQEDYLNVDAIQTQINAVSDTSLKKSLNKLLKAYSKALTAEAKALAKTSTSESKLASLHNAVLTARTNLVNALIAANINPTPYMQQPVQK